VTAFITFEGIEGSGKSTQIGLLGAVLRDDDRCVVVTREPGGTSLGEQLRRVLLDSDTPLSAESEAYLMTGARAEHIRQVIRPALSRGAIVLCDRFCDSTYAYQGAGRGLPIEALRRLQQLAIGTTTPQLTLLFDLPVEVGLERRRGGGAVNRIDRESREFHERVADWYRGEAARAVSRWRVIDATAPVGVVHTQVVAEVRRLIEDNERSRCEADRG